MTYRIAAGAAVLLALTCGVVRAQQPAIDTTKFVSREEYEKLRKEMEQMRAEMAELRKTQTGGPYASRAETDQALDELDKTVRQIKAMAEAQQPGIERILIAGDASIDFIAEEGSKSTFAASLAPLILWKLTDRLMFEAAFDIGISTSEDNESSTSFDLTIANANYLVNRYLTLGGGLFVVPFGVFHNHYDPPWINKLPDEPLPFGDNGIAPSSEVGIFAVGAFPINTTKLNYAIYLTNGPNLITNSPDAAGSLNFDDFTDLNNNKAWGGRIGFQPVPELEFGYSIMMAQVDGPDFPSTSALLQAVDAAYRKEFDWMKGTIDLRAEWVWSDVADRTYDPTGALGFGPLRFDNDRNGGYVQVAYRPTAVRDNIIRNFEPVFRYDRLEIPSDAPGGGREQRWTIGLDYWLRPNAVLKIAYRFDDRQQGEDTDALMIEFGIGL